MQAARQAGLRKWGLLFIIIGAVLAVDQVTKMQVMQRLALGESRQPIPALGEVFRITHSANTGAAFGLLPGAGDLFLVLAVAIVIGLVIFYPRLEGDVWMTRIALGLICGGALGNAYDRLAYDYVVDFIHYRIPGVVSNVSNIADHAIVLGVILVLFDSWRQDRLQKREAAGETTTEGDATADEAQRTS